MNTQIASFLFTTTGAFVCWMAKGFKGPFDNEMVSIDERSSIKGAVRFFLGLGIWILVILGTVALLS